MHICANYQLFSHELSLFCSRRNEEIMGRRSRPGGLSGRGLRNLFHTNEASRRPARRDRNDEAETAASAKCFPMPSIGTNLLESFFSLRCPVAVAGSAEGHNSLRLLRLRRQLWGRPRLRYCSLHGDRVCSRWACPRWAEPQYPPNRAWSAARVN